jgi:hypothetical protein
VPNLIPQDIREWMRRMEFKVNDLTRRMSNLIPGDIADSVDLDDYMSSGRWIRRSNIGTTTALNYPFDAAAGVLEVYWDPTFDQVHQVFHDRSGSRHSRWWNGASWSNWDGVWIDITTGFSAGVTAQTGGNTPQAMRQGNIVAVRGRVTVAAGTSGALDFGLLPAGNGFSPAGITDFGHGSISGTQTSRYFVSTGGQLQVTAWPNSGSNATGALSAVFGGGQ